MVAVELCKERADSLLSCDQHDSITWKEFFTLKGSLKEKIIRYISNELCVEPGHIQTMQEMKVAIQEGLAHGADVVYMDQDEDVTYKRFAQEFSFMQVIWAILRRKRIYREYPNFLGALGKGSDALMHPKALEELLKFADTYLPGLARSLVHERDAYMVKNLRKMSGSIVGVVGAVHVQGIHKLWQEAETSALYVQEVHKLCQ